MKKLFTKLFLASFPLLIVIAIYFYADPFKVLYHYNSYYDTSHEMAGVNNVTVNRDYISTESFLKNYDKYKYDSYIFGSSRSGFYQVKEWQKYINSTACFHYDGYNESLFGVEKKVEFLHKKGVKIKNALFVIDYELLAVTTNSTGPIYRKHPLISGESKLDFQLSMFKSFLDIDFITDNLKMLITHKDPGIETSKKPSVSAVTRYDETTNEERWWADAEVMIAENRDSFYRQREKIFYKRDTILHYADHVIKQEQIKMLTNIKKIMDADATEYRLIINPMYNQKKTDTTDLRILQEIFGKEKVYDFSGINEITQSIYNYYETSHYRTHIATQMMDTIYTKK